MIMKVCSFVGGYSLWIEAKPFVESNGFVQGRITLKGASKNATHPCLQCFVRRTVAMQGLELMDDVEELRVHAGMGFHGRRFLSAGEGRFPLTTAELSPGEPSKAAKASE